MSQWLKKPYIIIGIGVGVGVITCAVHLFKRQNKHEIFQTDNIKVTRNIKIPKGFVGHVLGRQGVTINKIRQETKTRINFDDEDNEFTVATISGLPENVEKAADLINNIITNRHACVTREIVLNESTSDSLWKNINYIKQVGLLTHAHVSFHFLPSKGKQESQIRVVIKGSKEEADAALEMIDELFVDVEVTSNKQTHVAGRALPDNIPLATSVNKSILYEKLMPNNPDGYIDVFVSAVHTPSEFWVQNVGYKSTQLDKLAIEMTEFYNDEKNKARFQLSAVRCGNIVSAFYEGDNSWYRAQVLEVVEETGEIKVFYLDFGDWALVSKDLVCAFNRDFLSIPFQALKCKLADIEPIEKEWSKEAIDAFSSMVYLAQWKVIMLKISESMSDSEVDNLERVPSVTLLDTSHPNVDLNISEQLVLNGHAKYISS